MYCNINSNTATPYLQPTGESFLCLHWGGGGGISPVQSVFVLIRRRKLWKENKQSRSSRLLLLPSSQTSYSSIVCESLHPPQEPKISSWNSNFCQQDYICLLIHLNDNRHELSSGCWPLLHSHFSFSWVMTTTDREIYLSFTWTNNSPHTTFLLMVRCPLSL